MTIAETLRKEGEARGEARGWAEAVLIVLAVRGIAVPSEARTQILACLDLAMLERWIARTVTISDAAELFEHS